MMQDLNLTNHAMVSQAQFGIIACQHYSINPQYCLFSKHIDSYREMHDYCISIDRLQQCGMD